MVQELNGLRKVLWENVLPQLLYGLLKTLPQVVGALSMFLVNKSGMGIQNPMTSAEENTRVHYV